MPGRPRANKGLLAVLCVAASMALPVSAGADNPSGSVMVLDFVGTRARSARKNVIRALRAGGIPLVDDKARRAVELRAKSKAREFRAASKKLGVAAFVAGRVQRTKRQWRLVLTITNGATGEVVGTRTWRAKSFKLLRRRVRKGVVSRTKRPLEAVRVYGSEEDQLGIDDDDEGFEEEEEELDTTVQEGFDDEDEDAGEEDRSQTEQAAAKPLSSTDEGETTSSEAIASAAGETPRASRNRVAVGLASLRRTYNYRDDLFDQLIEHRLSFAPAYTFEAQWFPFTHGSPWLVDTGISAVGFLSPGLSANQNDVNFPSFMWDGKVGIRHHRALASATLMIDAHYGRHVFSIGDTNDVAKPLLPSVKYQYAEVGIGGEVPFYSRLSLLVNVGYRFLFGLGEIKSQSYFPQASAMGVLARAALRYPLLSAWDVSLGARLVRYGFDLKPEPGDPLIAGGAVDQTVNIIATLGYRFR